MPDKNTPPILKLPWEQIELPQMIEARHVLINKQEFYALAMEGNLLFTPDEIRRAHERFITYPEAKRVWPIWELSWEDVEIVANHFELDLEGLAPDTILHYFKKGFGPIVNAWDEVLRDAIKAAITEKLIHE